VAAIYQETNEQKGTQLIFSDIGTPKSGAFNVYDAMKEKLVNEYQIPAAQIAFIHDWEGSSKQVLFDGLDSGKFRILLGSTEKAGTGLNVQGRMAAVHHLDIPWKPSEFEQRNGRAVRQGNWLAKLHLGNQVRVFIYAVEQSLDNYKFTLLKNKQLFIVQMKNSQLQVRVLDEGAMDEQSGMNYSEYIAILSGDTSLLEKAKLEKQLAALDVIRTSHYREQARVKDRLRDLGEKLESDQRVYARLQGDASWYIERLQYGKDGVKENPVNLIGMLGAEPEQIGKHLIALFRQWKPKSGDTTQRIGELYGFDLYIRQEKTYSYFNQEYQFHNSFYAERQGSGIRYDYSNGTPNVTNPKLAARYFISAIDRVENILKQYQERILKVENEIPVLQKITDRVFDRDQDILDMKTEVSRLEQQIKKKMEAQLATDYAPADRHSIELDVASEQSLNHLLPVGRLAIIDQRATILDRPAEKIRKRPIKI